MSKIRKAVAELQANGYCIARVPDVAIVRYGLNMFRHIMTRIVFYDNDVAKITFA